ncbi:hypothetical protein RB195_025241 [Necator americanus]|uniref:Uncharacterized protein n=1 Tax=Necator americanus TaxID=51031 RepID=A0ABR1ERG2_NECAM
MVWSRIAARGQFCWQNRSEARRFRREAAWEAKDADAMDRTKWKTRSRKADPATTRDKRQAEEEEEEEKEEENSI